MTVGTFVGLLVLSAAEESGLLFILAFDLSQGVGITLGTGLKSRLLLAGGDRCVAALLTYKAFIVYRTNTPLNLL